MGGDAGVNGHRIGDARDNRGSQLEDFGEQRRLGERLFEERATAEVASLWNGSGHEKDRESGPLGQQGIRECEAGLARHLDVGDEHIDGERRVPPEPAGVGGARCAEDGHSGAIEDATEQGQHDFVIVNHQHNERRHYDG